MLGSPDLSFSRTLSLGVFNRLVELLDQMAQGVGKANFVIITDAIIARIPTPTHWAKKRFKLLLSEGFSALLLGNPEVGDREAAEIPAKESEYLSLNAQLIFDADLISAFLMELRDLFCHDSITFQEIERYQQIISPNSAELQSKFTLLLLEYLLSEENQDSLTKNSSYSHLAFEEVEQALKKQIAQEKLLNQVTTQIRKSVDLSVIMATALSEVREFLELDRLVIYKFEHSIDSSNLKSQNFKSQNFKSQNFKSQNISTSPLNLQEQETPQEQETLEKPEGLKDFTRSQGYIVYEVCGNDAIPSVLNYRERNCFTPTSECWNKYCNGFTLTVNDIEETYDLEDCLLNFLREIQVRAKLASPIMFEENLWGLLIAHQCHRPRNWSDSEKHLLTSIAEQLAIAIHQSELMNFLTKEKQSLEKRVKEKTNALHDALVAAESASRLRNEFLATISHELLTPLTYVIGMSSTLLRWSFGDLSQRQRDYLQTIHDSGEHLLEMINDILNLSQIEAGKAVLNITEFSLNQSIETAVKTVAEKAIQQKINLTLDSQIELKQDKFQADYPRIQQILWNLLTNAIKFTSEGGDVVLRLWMEGKTAIFQVEDTGIGIPAEQLPLLFEKFHQLDTPYRRRYGGTGLGLALTKQLVELHRGRIEVDSSVGVGSIFTVWIPYQQSK
ncbi:sensor histidine kinase [Mastigocoleus testarum]|uniref:Circadian input-output histidine kinase CikA n=1 Tax=Mastigocoleus testarum BC008 TaxID=371196 RepID=A0A0V7ZF08_9CYAN|nr:GAF domain-containing sensor histidine kinase [Mastigocoleus testarum]KST63083.1 ATPase [Mastigocoleus testarum BC008]KST69059.1 ATPase [Mastigocoleus testarum BC008]